jgi:hypothetical protein
VIHGVGVLDTRRAPIPPPIHLLLAITDAAAGPAVHDVQVAALRSSLWPPFARRWIGRFASRLELSRPRSRTRPSASTLQIFLATDLPG